MHHQFQGFRPGDIVDGRYEIIDTIGKGGFGIVYRARQIAIDRVVALKILLPEADTVDPLAVERFRREAVLISSLESPNTITLIEFGQIHNGMLYTVMEFARGESLRNMLDRETKLPADRTVHIIRQVLSSLHEAHQRGIIHRDLKPANIMVGEYAGQSDHVKVLDFGIAKILKSGDTQSTLALTGRIVGTPRYMSPEQLRGANPTPASDLYALGLIVYEMLTGNSPITPSDPMEQVEAQMRPESFRLPQMPGVPIDLVTSINRSIEKDPAKRFQSAQDMSSALDAAMGKRPRRDPNKTIVNPMRQASVTVPRHQTLEAPADEGGGLTAYIIAAVVLFLFAFGGVAFLLVSDSAGGKSDGEGQPDAAQTSSESGGEQSGTTSSQGTSGALASNSNAGPTGADTTGPTGTETGQETGGTEGQEGGETGTDVAATGGEGSDEESSEEGGRDETSGSDESSGSEESSAREEEEEEETVAAVEEEEEEPEEPEAEEEEETARTVSVRVESSPSNVRVRVDGDRVGRTPLDIEVPADGSSIEIELRKSGCDTERVDISASDADGGVDVRLDCRAEEEEEEEEPEIPVF